MGYDVSFHPISPDEIQEWHFTPLTWIQQGQEEKVLALAMQHGIEDFYAEKYLDTLRVGAETEPDELFDKSHGFYIAVIQGFFRDYYYTRGVPFPFWRRRSRNMPGTSPPGRRWCPLPYPTRQRTRSLKTTAPACTCLQIRFCRFSGIWSRNQRYWKIWRNIGAMGSLLF